MRIKWVSNFPNPVEISRMKYYEFEIKGDVVLVKGDGLVIDYTIEQFKELFTPEIGNWEDIFKVVKKDADKTVK